MPALTELESRLAAPGGELVRGQCLKSLAEHEAQLRRAIAARLPREKFALASALLDATQAAQEVLHQFPNRWRA